MSSVPEELVKTRIGDLHADGAIEVAVGFPFGNHNSEDDGVPHIRPFNVRTDGRIDLHQIKSIPREAAVGKPHLRRGDVLFNNTNTKELVGKCALWDRDEEYVFSNHMTRIRVTSAEIIPAYLAFAILHEWMIGRSEMLARAHVAQASIMGERFREIEVVCRSPLEQEAVASLLRTLQEGYELERLQIDQSLELKSLTMRELFTGGMSGERQHESEIGPIPESWDVVGLGSLGRIGNGSTPKRDIKAYWEGGHYPWLTSAKVYDRLITAADEFVTDEALARCHLPRVKAGSLVMAITGQGRTLGNCALLGIEASVSQHLAYVSFNSSEVVGSYIRGYLETRYGYLRDVASGGGSTKGALTCAFLRDLPIPLPPTRIEQQEIADVLDAIDQKIDLHKQKKEALEELFRTLLHKLMTGEVQVSDLDLSALETAPTLEVTV